MIYELSPQALISIEEIIRYTDDHFGNNQTNKYIDGLFYSFDLLTENPKLGQIFSETTRRYLHRGNYIYYEIKDDVIFILNIRNTRMNLPPL